MTTTYRVVAIVPFYPPAFNGGGPIRSIHAMAQLAPKDMTVSVLTGDRDLGAEERLPVVANAWVKKDGVDVYYATIGSWLGYMHAMREVRRKRPNLIHLNSFMNPLFSIIPLMLWRLGFFRGAKVLLAPRGEFGEGALSRRAQKKRAYMRAFCLLGLPKRVIWHSTAPRETAEIIQQWGDGVHIVERGNDTLLPRHAREITDAPSNAFRAVFLGRIVEHKGLHIVLEALKSVTVPLEFHVYGSREQEAYFAECQSRAAEIPRHIQLAFHGPVAPGDVVTVLSGYDVMLMPTAGENFGHVIAEALCASCAVATTPHTPWTPILEGGGGLVIARSAGAWAEELQRLATEPAAERRLRRAAAGTAYENWAKRTPDAHVWMLARAALADSRTA
ncbi:glycosyltransferase family 4 protein [Microbacterium sp. W4I4]|uniref:glycosyltransferase family 4 protein n=1 Tax=Microbacterium sp. W4I4 TaxID=3042295 RepID=UPI0027D7F7FE|nr:glycosyltransferase family 4 protein [Microbacterium sp. W4I4]